MIRELIDMEVEAVVGGGNNSTYDFSNFQNYFNATATATGGNATSTSGNASGGPAFAVNALTGGQTIAIQA